MSSHTAAASLLVTACAAEHVGRFFAPPNQVVATKAARLYDLVDGRFLQNRVIVVRGDRIAVVGPGWPFRRGRNSSTSPPSASCRA